MKRITAVLLIILSTWYIGDLSVKDMPLWKLHQYKYTELLRLEPFCWCPYKSYLVIDKYVEVRDKNNTNSHQPKSLCSKATDNVWCDTGEVEVTYKAGVGLYIDKVLAS